MQHWCTGEKSLAERPVTRRDFLRLGGLVSGLAAAVALAPAPVLAGIRKKRRQPEKSLWCYNAHTEERLKTVYWANGTYVPEGLAELNHLLRDHYSGEVTKIDTRLYDLLYSLSRTLDYSKPFCVISGYRSPATNAMLRLHSHRVARNSLHMEGMAIDIRVPGRRSG